MSYSQVEVKNFVGLYLQQNSFTVPDGALEDALNCVITLNGVITKRRGFFKFVDPGSDVLNNLFLFNDRLLAVFTTKIQLVAANGSVTTLSGLPVSETNSRVARSAQANDNLYFTSDNGIMKLESFNGPVYSAGVPPALDLRAHFAMVNGPIDGNTQVGYRVVFGKRDTNKNLLLSTPSDVIILANRPVLASGYTTAGGGPFTVTVTTALPHNLTTGMVVTVSNATSVNANGTQTITVTSATTYTFVVGASPGAGLLDYTASRDTILEFSVPSEIDSVDYFWQLYRSSLSANADASPFPDFKLIKERQLTATELANDVVFYQDSILDIFAGSELYTNPNSREGELQANERPPLTADLCTFKNFTFYANTISRQNIVFSLVSSSTAFLTQGAWLEVKQDTVTRRYVARNGVGNSTVTAEAVAGVTTITVTYTAHGLMASDTVFISNVTGTIPSGTYTITGVAANTFTFTAPLGTTATALDFQGVEDASGFNIFQLVPPGSSPATGIDLTARGIVKAINRDPDSAVYARYLSLIDDIPGKIGLQSKGFNPVKITLRCNSIAAGQAFSPEIPDVFGVVNSDNDILPNSISSSKVGEPEAVPIVNRFPIGARNKRIQRIFALRDAVIILKEDGVFRLDGDRVSNFTSTILDSTIVCLSPSSAQVINNQIIFLSNQGVCMVSGSSVQIISRKIEAPIAAILGNANLTAYTSGVAYESERLYLLTTLAPNENTASVVYCYNTLTDSWTTWDTFFQQGIVGPNDKLFLITAANKIAKERKEQNKIDYSDQDYPATVVSVSSDKLAAVLNFGAVVPQAGDVLLQSSVISRIRTAAPSGANYALTFETATNLVAAQTPTLYARFQTRIKMAPFHGGAVGRSKQFAQMQVHTKEASISIMDITFSNDSFGSSEMTSWRAANVVGAGGWGQSPWGFFPWGLDSALELTYSTQPAPVIRSYVPLFAQRSTFIQTILEHNMAAEPLNIQALDFSLRGYGERVTR